MRSADITFVILTRDEAANIAGCLRSLPAGSPALVYDAFSQDDTAAQARDLGATVVQVPWAGYVRARAAAAALVDTPWTFMLDADERVTVALRDELADLAPACGTCAYRVARRNWFCGRWLRCAGWWPDRLVRLFGTGLATVTPKAAAGGAAIHETWQPAGTVAELSAPIEHSSYPNTAAYRRKFARYTALEAAQARGSLGAAAVAWLVAPGRFAWLMFAKAGILEGWRGVYVCAGSALYPAVVATKRWRRPPLAGGGHGTA